MKKKTLLLRYKKVRNYGSLDKKWKWEASVPISEGIFQCGSGQTKELALNSLLEQLLHTDKYHTQTIKYLTDTLNKVRSIIK